MDNIKLKIKNYIETEKDQYWYPYDMKDVKELHKNMEDVYRMASRDFSSFSIPYNRKKFVDESHRFNYSIKAFKSMLNKFFLTSKTKWIDSDEESFDKWYSDKSKVKYCIEGPLPKDQFMELFKELRISTDKIILSVYELKEPLSNDFDLDIEKWERLNGDNFTKVVFPNSDKELFPWKNLHDWFFTWLNNKLEIPQFKKENYELNFNDNPNGKRHNYKEWEVIDKNLKPGDFYTEFRASGYNILVKVKVNEEFAKKESLELNNENYKVYESFRYLMEQII